MRASGAGVHIILVRDQTAMRGIRFAVYRLKGQISQEEQQTSLPTKFMTDKEPAAKRSASGAKKQAKLALVLSFKRLQRRNIFVTVDQAQLGLDIALQVIQIKPQINAVIILVLVVGTVNR